MSLYIRPPTLARWALLSYILLKPCQTLKATLFRMIPNKAGLVPCILYILQLPCQTSNFALFRKVQNNRGFGWLALATYIKQKACRSPKKALFKMSLNKDGKC